MMGRRAPSHCPPCLPTQLLPTYLLALCPPPCIQGSQDPELLHDRLLFDPHQVGFQLCELRGPGLPGVWSEPLSPPGGAGVSHRVKASERGWPI